ncbi:MAG: type II 3-dehydroquinate dehydratase [Gammaproteobacteria bacterium]
MSDPSLLVLNGPGLANMEEFADDTLGITSLKLIQHSCTALCANLGLTLDFRQSDNQDEVVRWVREDANQFDALIINQMGCAERTSIDYAKYCADLEVLSQVTCRVTEIHMTNVLRYDEGAFKALRGPDGKTALICGLGADSYHVAIRAAVRLLTEGAS